MARYRVRDVARDEDNNAIVGASASLRRESDNVEVADSTTTGSDGSFGWLEEDVKYPGPVKTIVTALDGVVRQQSGKNTGQVGTYFMSDLARAFMMMTDGVVDDVDLELMVSASGASLEVSVAAGMAFIFGHPSYWAASTDLDISANGTGNPRKDLVVLRLYPPGTAREGEMELAVVIGTPAASPVAPTITQDQNVRWELALAEVTVPAGAATISGGNVVDVRTFSSGPLMNSSVITAKLADLAVTTAKLADEAVTVAKMTAGAQVSTAEAASVLKAAATADSPPAYAQLAIGELSDVATTAPADEQVLAYDTTTALWRPVTPSQMTLVIQEGDTTVVAQAATLDFSASPFAVTESPSNEANIDIAALGIDTTRIADLAVTNAKVATAIDATKIADGSVTNTEFQHISTVSSNVQTQLDAKSDTGHTHAYAADDHEHTQSLTVAGKATKTYTATNITSTAADGVELAGFDVDVPGGGGTVLATGHAQASAPASVGSYIELGVKIGSSSTEWGMRTHTVGGERGLAASSTRVYPSGASGQRISLRARVDGGTGSINAAHVNCFGSTRTDAPS